MIRTVTHCQLLRNITIRINNFIGSISQKKFRMDIPVCLTDHMFSAQLLYQAGDLQTALEIGSDANEAQIKVRNT